jgi:hypothetical protein
LKVQHPRTPPLFGSLCLITASSLLLSVRYHLEWSDELQAIEKELLDEVESSKKELHPTHAPTFTVIIQRRIALLKETLGIIEANPNITVEDLAGLVDLNLETQERALQNAKNVFDTDRIFTDVRILQWIKYLIIEKGGRVPNTSDTDE